MHSDPWISRLRQRKGVQTLNRFLPLFFCQALFSMFTETEYTLLIPFPCLNHVDLTRFNNIAIQGTPQMAVDKEALICLSRVYSYYFKCNFPLFYVYPALTRYLSILFLNILTLLACTHSSDNLFHTLMVICENENFLTSNLLCFFTRVKLCPLVILLSLIWKKRLESIFS